MCFATGNASTWQNEQLAGGSRATVTLLVCSCWPMYRHVHGAATMMA
jgi:hypothetical protein